MTFSPRFATISGLHLDELAGKKQGHKRLALLARKEQRGIKNQGAEICNVLKLFHVEADGTSYCKKVTARRLMVSIISMILNLASKQSFSCEVCNIAVENDKSWLKTWLIHGQSSVLKLKF